MAETARRRIFCPGLPDADRGVCIKDRWSAMAAVGARKPGSFCGMPPACFQGPEANSSTRESVTLRTAASAAALVGYVAAVIQGPPWPSRCCKSQCAEPSPAGRGLILQGGFLGVGPVRTYRIARPISQITGHDDEKTQRNSDYCM